MGNAVDLHGVKATVKRPAPPKADPPTEPGRMHVMAGRSDAFRLLSEIVHTLETQLPTVPDEDRGALVYRVLQIATTEAVLCHSRASAPNAPTDAAAFSWVGARLLRIVNDMVPGVRLDIKAKVVPHNPGDMARAFREFHAQRKLAMAAPPRPDSPPDTPTGDEDPNVAQVRARLQGQHMTVSDPEGADG